MAKLPGTAITDSTITSAQLAAANVDGVANVASLRTLGTGAQQAAAGIHAHASTAITADSSGLTNITGATVAAQMTSIDGQLGGSGRALIAGDANTQIELQFAEASSPFANSGAYGALNFTPGAAATLFTQQGGFLGDYALSVLNNGDRGGLTTGNTSACEYGSAITLSGWFRFGAVNGGFAITKLYNLAGQQWGLNGKFASISLVAYADDVESHYNIGGTNKSLVKGTPGLSPAGSWNFFAATYDGHYIRLYVNGALVGTSVDHAAAIDWGSHGPWCVGGLDATSLGGGTANQYSGMIYRPRVENVVRSRAYLAEVYYRGMGLPAAGL